MRHAAAAAAVCMHSTLGNRWLMVSHDGLGLGLCFRLIHCAC